AVDAVPDAVHLEPHPHLPVIGGIDGDPRGPWDPDVRAVRRDVHGQLLPGLPGVGGAIDARLAGRARPREHHVRIDRIDGHAPDHGPLHRRVEQAPVGAAAVALVETHVGPGVDDIRPPRIRQQRPHNAVGMHALAHAGPCPALAVVGAHHHALADRPHQNGALVRHGPPPDVVRTVSAFPRPRLYAYRRGSATLSAAPGDRRPPHAARPILRPAAGRELLDIDTLSANPLAHRTRGKLDLAQLGKETPMAERLGLAVIPGVGWRANEIQAIAREAEDAGFDAIFAAEVNNDVMATAQLMGTATRRIQVGTWIANIYLRHSYACAQG